MSGGQKINDHGSWIGKGNKGSVFPEGVKTKAMKEGEGAGELARYEDSAESIKSFQDKARSQAKSRPMKPEYRN
jgi:hypothetical protein